MSCKNQNDEVYMDLMNQRTQYDKDQIKQYNCINFERTYSDSMVSMLAPSVRTNFQQTKSIDLGVSYQLNPTAASVKAAQGSSSTTNKGVYPPKCGFDQYDKNQLCSQSTPGPYASLDIAYNPTIGSKCINLGQDLNFQYGGKK